MVPGLDQPAAGVSPRTQSTYQQRVLKVLLFLQARLDDPPTLDELAAVAHFSPYHFHHVFRGMVGESVGQHLKRLRLERAALRLRSEDDPITRVALDAGYETHEAFTRAFTAHFNCSPSDYRRRHEDTTQRTAALLRQGQLPVPAVRIESFPARRVAFVRHIGPYDDVGAAWGTLMRWAGSRGLMRPSMMTLGIPLDAPDITPTDKLRYDACLVVGPEVEPDGPVGVQALAGGPHALLTHRGPYDRLGESYDALFGAWLPGSGREPAHAPCVEIYLNSPFNTKPQDLLTDVCVPLKG